MVRRAAPASASRDHLQLVALLTFVSGCVDVVTLMALGGAFTSVITGNLIFIGRAIGTSSLTPAEHALLAVAGYVAGVALGGRLAHVMSQALPDLDTPWPRRATAVLGVEALILFGLNIAWLGFGGHPGSLAIDIMLVAAAVALGMQGAAARTVKGAPSTTYMTGALTTLIEALVTGRHRGADPAAAIGLLMLVCGGAVSAVLVEHARRAALLPALIAVAAAVLLKLRDHRKSA